MSQDNLETSPRFHPAVEGELRRAGWYPDRLVEEHIMDQWYAIPFDFLGSTGYHLMFPAAYRFLREFGGLIVGRHDKPGMEVAISPLEVEVPDDVLTSHEWIMETRLFPIGYFPSQPYYYLMIDLAGAVWGMFEDIELIGGDIDEAISNLVIGFRSGIKISVDDAANSTNGYIASLVEDAIRAHRKG